MLKSHRALHEKFQDACESRHDTLDENEVHVGEVQVDLYENMIETTPTNGNYKSYDSKDDTFTWKLIEMNNESFDIPQQGDAPKKS